MKPRVLIVDDEPDMLSTCRAALAQEDVSVILESRAPRALERLRGERFELVVADVRMPGLDGVALLKASRARDAALPVIMMTAYPEVASAVEALRAGARDYLVKPFDPDDFRLRVLRALDERRLRDENELLARHLGRDYAPAEIIGGSPALLKVLELADRAAPRSAEVLILGESGTGKELLARRIHARSGRRGRFVPIDCGAIPENLLENELFGHEKGAYTDAASSAPGLLEWADRGTLFLDEVAELPLPLQAKLLRTLQERQFRRLGGRELVDVDLRVVAATNKDLPREVRAGCFREDLYYRLNVVDLRLPPLRERREDIQALAEHFLARLSREEGRAAVVLTEEALAVLRSYEWPGNVRELSNALKKAAILSSGEPLKPSDLPDFLLVPADAPTQPGGFQDLRKLTMRSFEREYFQSLLKEHRGDVAATAAAAGLPLSTFYWRLKRTGLLVRDFRP